MGYQNRWFLFGLIVLVCQLIVLGLAEENEPESGSSEDDVVLSRTSQDEEEVVSLFHGDIRGFLETSSKGHSFYSFLGIPYAKPPTGSLRFKDPEMLEDRWEGIRDGSIVPPSCAQIDLNSLIMSPHTTYKGQEDCLYLNIYTSMPNFPYADLPVMVYIHGGQFMSGGASDYEPYDLLNQPMVLVVIQYRLGVLGFTSTEDLVMPGNLGLKDQTMALRWIHRNVENFGGSPTRITVFGSGAGSASVHYQTLSHHTIGLFKRAILQSGNALCPWAQGGIHKEAAYHIGKQFKCLSEEDEEKTKGTDEKGAEEKGEETKRTKDKGEETKEAEKKVEETKGGEENAEERKDNEPKSSDEETEKAKSEEETSSKQDDDKNASEATDDVASERKKKEQIKHEQLLHCLQNVDVEELLSSAAQFYMWSYLPVIFGPRVDNRYLPDTPQFLLKMGRHKRVELIIGINKEDGSHLTNSMFMSEGRRMALKHHFPLIGPISLEFSDDDIAPLNMSIKAYDKYAGGLTVDAADALNLTKLYTDRHYGVCSDMVAEMHAANNERYKKNVYFYEFEHRGERSTGDQFGLNFGQQWVAHGDELFYLFPFNKSKTYSRDEEDQKMTDLMTKMWFSFAETGNPTPNVTFDFTWKPYSKENRHHLKLTPAPSMEEDGRKEVREFWTSLPTLQNVFLNKEYFMKILNGTDLKEEESAGLDLPPKEQDKPHQTTNQETNIEEETEKKQDKDEL